MQTAAELIPLLAACTRVTILLREGTRVTRPEPKPPRLVGAGDPTTGPHGQSGAPSLRSSLLSPNIGPLKPERLNRRSESFSIIINHRDPPEESHASSFFPPELNHLLRRTHQYPDTNKKTRPKKKEGN
ncbi:hypothetical protein IGI04_034807 [Brassica rapa subsp. trilocularis]|uniref:Uncharacterized protein n=1 Tax=Brassica rapa subsp. trilocularis TaxID=1813537 RepID=A0ABQ7LAU9_BRACM|nr:hypothetical protein IGI04_034807 [Brassica rapa subsp. trilocularis]